MYRKVLHTDITMTDKLFSENIFHCSKAYANPLAFKLGNRMPATINEVAFIKQVKNLQNGAFDIAQAYVEYFSEKYSTRPDVAYIPIIGEMSRYSYWSYGNEFLMQCLNRIEANEQYKGVVLRVDTGGGTADSCNIFADTVASFSKPKITYTNNCCSAGYFIASQSDEIIVEPQAATQIGSLGTLIIYQNYMAYLEKSGIATKVIRAEQSIDKAIINPFEEFTKEMEDDLIAKATVACKEFHGYVKRGRAGKITSEEVFTGKTYSANEAIKLGLADRTGTFKDAVNRVITLSKK